MTPQLRRKPKLGDLSATTPAPVAAPEPDEHPSPAPAPLHNQALISSIPITHTHFSTSPLLHPNQPSILTLLSPQNHTAWLSWHSSSSILSPIVVKEIRELGMYEDVDGKYINYSEGGTLVLMSKVGYEKFVRWRGRRGKAVLS